LNEVPDFSLFFNRIDYFKFRGKGFSVFNASSEVSGSFLRQCKGENVTYDLIRASELAANTPNLPGAPSIVVVIQDLPYRDFMKRVGRFVDQLIFPLWYQQSTICFFSTIDRCDYLQKKITSGTLHSNFEEVIDFLLCEQMISLLDRVTHQFAAPEYLSPSQHKTHFTPIEQTMQDALENASMEYEPQVRIGNYYVDFLVSVDSRKVIVECDGRSYHNTERDAERDKVLLLEGYPILHFSGSEIYSDCKKCVEAILNVRNTVVVPNHKIDEDLDMDQMRGMKYITGPVRVLAPAGSGKTKTLTNRIAYLINQGVPEDRILALAFNKKARDEMQERVAEKYIGGVEVRTFHSLGYEIIRNHLQWIFRGNSERRGTRELLRKAIEEHFQLPPRRNKDPLDAFLDALRKTKMELPKVSDVTVEFDEKLYPFEGVFNSYLELQLKHNFFNFNDMIYLAVRILLDQSTLRKQYQNKFEYILVDEYQDLNRAQLLLLQILSMPDNNVFVVGDDDQMIYGWRGAEIRHIVDFHKRFPITQDCVLSTNYRSSKKVVRHSGWLIDHNNDRVRKNIRARKGAQEGSLEIELHANLWEQAKSTASWLKKMKGKHNLRWKDFSVLYRYNAYEFPVAMALDTLQIPHTPVDGCRLFRTRVGRDVYAYLTVILNPQDADAEEFSRILKRPNKYLTNQIISKVCNWTAFLRISDQQGLGHWERDMLKDFVSRIETLRRIAVRADTSPSKLMSHLSTEIGLLEFYKDQSRLSDDLDHASDEVLFEVVLAFADNFSDLRIFYQFIHQAFHDESDLRVEEDPKRDEVVLSTIHRAKGKEFTNVAFFNLSQDVRYIETTDWEEERRVAYVGVTRARDNLLITALRSRPSRFLKELALNPKLQKYSTPKLQSQKSILQRRLAKYRHDKEQFQKRKRDILARFPELRGEMTETPKYFGFLYQLLAWIREKRLQSAVRQLEDIENNITYLRENPITRTNNKIDIIDTDIKFRSKLLQVGLGS